MENATRNFVLFCGAYAEGFHFVIFFLMYSHYFLFCNVWLRKEKNITWKHLSKRVDPSQFLALEDRPHSKYGILSTRTCVGIAATCFPEDYESVWDACNVSSSSKIERVFLFWTIDTKWKNTHWRYYRAFVRAWTKKKRKNTTCLKKK